MLAVLSLCKLVAEGGPPDRVFSAAAVCATEFEAPELGSLLIQEANKLTRGPNNGRSDPRPRGQDSPPRDSPGSPEPRPSVSGEEE